MVYSLLFMRVLLYVSLFGLVGVFGFQLYYFVKDIREKDFWN